MPNTSPSVTSGCRGRCFLTQSVRPHLTTCLTLASAVVLGLSLVSIPPDVSGTRTEVRSVQLAAFRPHSATPLGTALRKLRLVASQYRRIRNPGHRQHTRCHDRWRTGSPRVRGDAGGPFSPSNGD